MLIRANKALKQLILKEFTPEKNKKNAQFLHQQIDQKIDEIRKAVPKKEIDEKLANIQKALTQEDQKLIIQSLIDFQLFFDRKFSTYIGGGIKTATQRGAADFNPENAINFIQNIYGNNFDSFQLVNEYGAVLQETINIRYMNEIAPSENPLMITLFNRLSVALKVFAGLTKSDFSDIEMPKNYEKWPAINKAAKTKVIDKELISLNFEYNIKHAREIHEKKVATMKATNPITSLPNSYRDYLAITHLEKVTDKYDKLDENKKKTLEEKYKTVNPTLEDIQKVQDKNFRSTLAEQFIHDVKLNIEHIDWTDKVNQRIGGTAIQLNGKTTRVPTNVATIYKSCIKAESDHDFRNHFNKIVSVGNNAAKNHPFFGKRHEDTQNFYDTFEKAIENAKAYRPIK
ncbi:MAG: hypothetical protein H0U73_12960 [Tatlockia sp.]|nr:hypothetical protein [Tatlockia sp.]